MDFVMEHSDYSYTKSYMLWLSDLVYRLVTLSVFHIMLHCIMMDSEKCETLQN